MSVGARPPSHTMVFLPPDMALDMNRLCPGIPQYDYLEWEEVEGVVCPVRKKFVPTEKI